MSTARCRRDRPPQGYFLQLQRRIADFYEESEEEDAYCDDPTDDDVELYVPEGMHEISRIVTRSAKVQNATHMHACIIQTATCIHIEGILSVVEGLPK